ncbi:multiubiquitin domain-containing protein [Paraburkholderia sediminicola]|uniref:multiubiquitin domain-containing protein n=1 Tax=Paraburkholderia sediminicola TaxID=458836 RepID=UPI0038BDA7F7
MTEHEQQHGHESRIAEELEEAVVALEEEVVVLEELIDLEEWAKANKEPKRAKRYRLRIDKEYEVVEVHSMTGRQILALVRKTPETYLLSQKFRGGRVEPVKADETVEFHRHQIERFQTLALDPTEG